MSTGFGFRRNLLNAGERLLHPSNSVPQTLGTASGATGLLTMDSGKAGDLLRSSTGIGAKSAKLKSQRDLAAMATNRDWPTQSSAYDLLEDCGRGVSATVHKALCIPLNEIVAVKKMNLESMNCDLDEIIQEAHTMKQYNHPNVLPLYCSFVDGQDLWLVMPFIAGGSVLHIMKYAYPEGLDEVVIATILRDVLKALDYVHKNGAIHRDIKAGNILIDKDGAVKLADFGVAAKLERGGDWGHDKQSRMTFVGTPCWMAPEVMEQTLGYDSSADIWSCGITILEMAHGHAPFAKFPPMKVLLMTLQNPPPTLDDKGKKHFSKLIKDVVTRCLQKDPSLRPTAAALLEHKFFKQARDDEYLSKHLVSGLPTLGERVQLIRQGKAATNTKDNDADFVRSQEEYKKGVSSWNFDVAALKAQAAAEGDDPVDALPSIAETDEDALMMSGRLNLAAMMTAAAAVAAANAAPTSPPLGTTSVPPLTPQPSGGWSGGVGGGAAPPPPPLAESVAQPLPELAHPSAAVVLLAAGDVPPATPAMPPAGAAGSRPEAPPSTSYHAEPYSAFATPQGQAQASNVIASCMPATGEAAVLQALLSTSQSSQALPPTASTVGSPPRLVPLVSDSGDGGAPSAHVTPLSPTGAGPSHAAVPVPSSPRAMSREGSTVGPLSNLVTTPTGAKKEKKGRFQVYEDGEVPPPLSPGPSATEQMVGGFREPLPPTAAGAGASTSSSSQAQPPIRDLGGQLPSPPLLTARDSGIVNLHSLLASSLRDNIGGGGGGPGGPSGLPSRLSDDGRAPPPASVEGEDSAGAAAEPKKRGRFKIIEEAAGEGTSRTGISKATSLMNLSDAQGPTASVGSRSQQQRDSSNLKMDPLGRPPTVPAALPPPPSGTPSIAAVLPKLQELLDHQAQQTQALQRLMAAVHDVERGRATPPMFARPAPGRSLFEPAAPASSSGTTHQGDGEGDGVLQDLKHRLSVLEEDNVRLRLRNHQLESMLSIRHGGSGGGPPRDPHTGGGAAPPTPSGGGGPSSDGGSSTTTGGPYSRTVSFVQQAAPGDAFLTLTASNSAAALGGTGTTTSPTLMSPSSDRAGGGGGGGLSAAPGDFGAVGSVSF